MAPVLPGIVGNQADTLSCALRVLLVALVRIVVHPSDGWRCRCIRRGPIEQNLLISTTAGGVRHQTSTLQTCKWALCK